MFVNRFIQFYIIDFFFSFNDILLEISKIPLLPALLENNSEERARMEGSTNNIKNKTNQSLLEWVTARQGLTNLEHIIEHCENSLKQVVQINISLY